MRYIIINVSHSKTDNKGYNNSYLFIITRSDLIPKSLAMR